MASVKRMTVDECLAKLDQCGWFDAFPAKAQRQYRQQFAKRARQEDVPSRSLLWIGDDSECIDGPGDYTDQLKTFANQSVGMFKPQKIAEDWVLNEHGEKIIHFAFTHDGRRYGTVMPCDSDYIEQAFFDLIDRAMQDSGTPIRFIPVAAFDQCFFFVFTTAEAAKKAWKMKLIPRLDV
jgi:hypothetical protein